MALEPACILVFDDDAPSTRALRATLASAGASAVVCPRAAGAAEALDFHRPHAAIVDVGMERELGWDVLRAIRGSGVAAVALDRAHSPERRRTAFANGADEVVAKPVDAFEIAARVLALAARSRADVARRLHRRNGLVFDADARRVQVDGHDVALTVQQMRILESLFEARGAAVSRRLLADRISGVDDDPPSDRAVDLHVSRLRRRLCRPSDQARFIEAVPGVGYRLAQPRATTSIAAGAASLLDAVREPILLVDTQLHIRHANAATCALTGQDGMAVAGRICGDVLDCRDATGSPLLPRCLARAAATGEVPLADVDGSIMSPDGRVAVSFSCGRVRGAMDEGLLALTLRPARD